MSKLNHAQWRLCNQSLLSSSLQSPEEVVKKLCAVQAQDYPGALWALGLRLPHLKRNDIEDAVNAGKILRTHLLRPTWHFVLAEDIRWLLMISAPRVNANLKHNYRKAELDEKIFVRCRKVIEKSLRDGKHLTRAELRERLSNAGIVIQDGIQMSHVMMEAELGGLICSGAQRGNQFTYALLEERAPAVPAITRDEALATIVSRYFSTRGPATLQDFAWWSGLTIVDAKRGIEVAKTKFSKLEIDRQTYWFDEANIVEAPKKRTAFLLPNFDEFFIGFKDRSAFYQRLSQDAIAKNPIGFGGHILFVNDQVVGTWKRALKKDSVNIEWKILAKLSKDELKELALAASRYATFLGLSLESIERE